MGLKSGSRDAGLEDEEEDETEETGDEPGGTGDRDDQPADPDSDGTTDESTGEAPGGGDDGRPSMDAIPYKLRREKVNEGRQQVPYFLREEVIAAEDELQDTLEELLGEDIYKSDYREAAMVVAQRNPDLVASVLREWGYDLG
jgi:hypothetical protein